MTIDDLESMPYGERLWAQQWARMYVTTYDALVKLAAEDLVRTVALRADVRAILRHA